MTSDTDFRWPDDPPADWWLAEGAARHPPMRPEMIRYAAAKYQFGKEGSRKNLICARLAGLEGGRGEAYRADRSVGVQYLLRKAFEVQAGNLPPVTEELIDRRIDDLLRSPDEQTFAKGLEIRNKRDNARAAAMRAEDTGDPADTCRKIILALPADGGGAVLAAGLWFSEFGQLGSFLFLKECAPILARRVPQEWRRWRGDGPNELLDRMAAGPVLEPDELVAALKASDPRSRMTFARSRNAVVPEARDAA